MYKAMQPTDIVLFRETTSVLVYLQIPCEGHGQKQDENREGCTIRNCHLKVPENKDK